MCNKWDWNWLKRCIYKISISRIYKSFKCDVREIEFECSTSTCIKNAHLPRILIEVLHVFGTYLCVACNENKNEWEKAYLSCRVRLVISTLKRCISSYFIISCAGLLSTSAIFSECSLRNVIWKSQNKINFCMKLLCDQRCWW